MNDAEITRFEDLVRNRAYAMWENEGRPAGRDAEHWRLSEEATRAELALADAPVAAKPKSKPAPRKKAPAKRPAALAEIGTRH